MANMLKQNTNRTLRNVSLPKNSNYYIIENVEVLDTNYSKIFFWPVNMTNYFYFEKYTVNCLDRSNLSYLGSKMSSVKNWW